MQVLWFGRESWFGTAPKPTKQVTEHQDVVSSVHQSLPESHNECTHLLTDAVSSSIHNDPLYSDSNRVTGGDGSTNTSIWSTTRTCRYWCITMIRIVSMTYIVFGLVVFAMGIFWRTRSFLSLLGPLSCLCIILIASEYYHARRSRQCMRKRLTEMESHKQSIQ